MYRTAAPARPTTFPCDRCGKTVRWALSKAGTSYLQDLSQEYDNGARYNRGPHFKTCAQTAADRDARLAANAAHEANQERLRKGNAVMFRWAALHGEDLRAWFEADHAAADAHFKAVYDRAYAVAA